MEKKGLDYTVYPTVTSVSERDLRMYQLSKISFEDLVSRMEALEAENKKSLEREVKMEAEVEYLKQGMAAMKNMLFQLTLGQLKKGEFFIFGRYQGEPIEWQVLDVIDGKALLLSHYGLDTKRYHEKWREISWRKSDLRQWLNQEFYKNAFSLTEQNRIHSVKLINADNPVHGTAGGKDTQDQVFLLSIDDVQKYFDGNSACKCTPTAYAKRGIFVNADTGTCNWWLRSPGSDSRSVSFVNTVGVLDSIGYPVDEEDLAVRPALWINLES